MNQKSIQTIKSLQQAIKNQDVKQINILSSNLLQTYPQDVDYIYSYALSSIRLNLINQLRTSIFKIPPSSQSLKQLYAYTLYSIPDYKTTIQYIKNNHLQSINAKLLLSHAYFKTLNYKQSAQIMQNLLNQQKLKISPQDRQSYSINLLATLDQTSENSNKIIKQHILPLLKTDSYKQLIFNYTLYLFRTGDLKECQIQLFNYQKILSKQQRNQQDFICLDVFKRFIQWTKSKGNDSQLQYLNKIKQNKLINKIFDKNLTSVIQCNLIASQNINLIQQDANLYQKIFDDFMNINQFKISRAQLIGLKINKVSLLLRKNKINQGFKILKQLQSLTSFQNLMKNRDYLKNRYFILKKNKNQKQINELIDFLRNHGQSDLAQLFYIDYSKQVQSQAFLINQFKEKIQQQNPVIKNYIFSLLISDPKNLQLQTKYLQELTVNSNDIKVLQILIQIYQNTANFQKQKFVIQKILKINPKNSKAKTKLAKLYLNEGNYLKTEQLLRGIDQPQEITDISYLQHIEKNMHISIKKQEDIQQIPTNKHQNITNQHKKRIKKRKKLRLPKNAQFVQNFKPDHQRWLPKWQRKGNKKKGKKGAGKTQGLATIGKQQTKNVFMTGASTSNKQVTKDPKKKR